MFQDRHHNRHKFPTKHVLICEDFLDMQCEIMKHFASRFESQGIVQFSLVAGARAAAGVILATPIDLILLDFDMPNGNGADLMGWLRSNGYGMPVLTFSGLKANNDELMRLGAHHKFSKDEVLLGKADLLICSLLGV